MHIRARWATYSKLGVVSELLAQLRPGIERGLVDLDLRPFEARLRQLSHDADLLLHDMGQHFAAIERDGASPWQKEGQ